MGRAYNPTFSRNKRSLTRVEKNKVDHEASTAFFFDLTGREPGAPSTKPILTQSGIHTVMVAGPDVRHIELTEPEEIA